MLIVYVDDTVFSRDDPIEITRLKQKMGDEFEIKDLRNLKYFLGMEVARSREGNSVSQRKYTLDLLKRTYITRCIHAFTPMEFNAKQGNYGDKVSVDREVSEFSGKVNLSMLHETKYLMCIEC